jgi:hypothetical protein
MAKEKRYKIFIIILGAIPLYLTLYYLEDHQNINGNIKDLVYLIPACFSIPAPSSGKHIYWNLQSVIVLI